jgi:thiol:disulfide interchange protein DsbD
MAAPYLMMSAFPQLLRFLPKPGMWMVVFKEGMGFLMLGTVLWLTWIYGAQTSSQGVAILLCALFLISFGFWNHGKWGTPTRSKITRWASNLITIACLTAASYLIISQDEASAIQQVASIEAEWEEYSEERLNALRVEGIPVFIDFTAKWCLICQTNHLVLSTPELKALFKEHGVVRMKADWTKKDAHITQALKRQGRNSVPLYLLYGSDPKAEPAILPQVLTPEVVKSHLKQLPLPAAKS